MTFDVTQDKIALRVVQNAEIHLDGVRVPEANRLQDANSFEDTAKVLKVTRMGVAWQATGCARGAYEHALRYTHGARSSSASRSPASSSCRTCWCKMLGQRRRLHRDVRAGLAAAGRRAWSRTSTPRWPRRSRTARMRETVGWAREVLGGNGILLEHHVGRFVADAEAIYSYEGTREINTLIVGRAITGESAFV